MADYDNKLGEWFKQVEKLEQEVKAKRKPGAPASPEREAAGERSQRSVEPSVPALARSHHGRRRVARRRGRAGAAGGTRDRRCPPMLPNGTVLVAGGQLNGTVLASAEIYDPVGNLWTAVASLNAARYLHTATLLANGKVLVAGGEQRRGPRQR